MFHDNGNGPSNSGHNPDGCDDGGHDFCGYAGGEGFSCCCMLGLMLGLAVFTYLMRGSVHASGSVAI